MMTETLSASCHCGKVQITLPGAAAGVLACHCGDCQKMHGNFNAFEEGLPPAQRKRLGQLFTGLPLGTLLAHIALDPDARAVIDPMAGHGDLLDAAALTARARDARLGRLDGIELDPEPSDRPLVSLRRSPGGAGGNLPDRRVCR
jgi:hypothetical protein